MRAKLLKARFEFLKCFFVADHTISEKGFKH
jgi:hypothetical protein